jgi:hypothetical protein
MAGASNDTVLPVTVPVIGKLGKVPQAVPVTVNVPLRLVPDCVTEAKIFPLYE